MEPVFLKQPINNNPSDDSLSDLNAPFSFLEWKRRRPNIIEKQASLQYNGYVLDWFTTNKAKTTTKAFLLRQKYLYLLDQLQLFFSEKEKHDWYNKINLMDEKELLLSIPYFAKKLKHVALYYLNLRKELKNTKLKYNTVGTAFGIEQDLYNAMLKTFSTLNEELLPEVKSVVPELSAIRESLVIQIEELYDDKDYFDVSSSLPVADRFDVFNGITGQFYQTKGIVLSSEEWMLNCLSLSADLDFNTFVDRITGTILETTDAELYSNYVAKYLSENKFSVEFNSLSSEYELTQIPLQAGNNYFYYPGGITDPTVLFEKKLTNVSLSSLTIDGATAGSSLETSDTVFVKNGKDIKGAWLRYKEHEDEIVTIETKIKQYDTTSFLFPYPGYGLSGEGISWTGPSFRTTPEYDFLANTLRAAINNSYWSYEFDSNSIVQVPINNTTLIDQGAKPDRNPNFADRIFIKTHNNLDLTAPGSVLSGTWLYRFEDALFPISPTSENRFLWPFCLIDPTEDYPSHFNDVNFSKVCEPVSITNFNSSHSIGSSSIDTSDKIYKFSKYSDDVNKATECCWLSCDSQTLTFHKAFKQNGFNSLFKTGVAEKFVWNGPNNTPLDTAFKSVPHKQDCPFVTNVPEVSSLEWQKCTCKQVYYSPFGHSGNFYENNNGFADFIAKDYSNGTREFDMDSWRDISGLPFKGSLNVAWYKTNSPNPTWGGGQWVNNNSAISTAPFLLQTGQSYYYKRAENKTSADTLPPYSVFYPFSLTNQGKWMGAKLNEDGEWVSTNLPSNIIFYPGDVIKYERASQTTQYLISSELVEDTSKNKGSAWSTFDYIVSGTPQSTVYLSWPMDIAPIGVSSTAQYPPFGLLSIKELYWWKIQHATIPSVSALIESPFTILQSTSAVPSSSTTTVIVLTSLSSISTSLSSTTFISVTSLSSTTNITSMFVTLTSKSYSNRTTISFTPPITGVYNVSAFAKDIAGLSALVTNVPPLTVVPQYFSKELLVKQGTTSNGFLLEQPLYGWDYLAGKSSLGASGAKPFWAQLYVGKEKENRFKGAYSWGYSNNFIDGYIPDHSPRVSPINLDYGQSITYERVGSTMNWIQPITFKSYSGSSEWCALSVITTDFSNLSSVYNSKQISDLNALPLLIPTDIQLTNIENGLPVEVFYYALNSFTWTISTESQLLASDPTQILHMEAFSPWANLNNRFYSSVATIPLLDEIYSENNVGGYFIPQNLGASLAINKEFESHLKTTSLSGKHLVEDLNIHIGGRGRTRQDQQTLYTWKEQNQWMKEPPTAGKLAGSVKRNLTKTLQTFTPYEEAAQETFLGLVTPSSRVSPWEGTFGNIWTDTKNEPKSLTEVRNVSAWVDSQILKQNKLVADNWTSDIFGNQYALFKDLSGKAVSDRQQIPGELWIRTNEQTVKPANEGLLNILDLFKTKTFYADLTGSGILSIDCFFDTLMIETPTAVVFCPLEYNYGSSTITSIFDNCVVVENLTPTRVKFERTWMFPKTKNVIVLCTELSSNTFTPNLYNLNLNDKSYSKIFPLRPIDLHNVQLGLSGINVDSIDRASIYYNSLQQTYLINYKGLDVSGKLFFVDFKIEQLEDLILAGVDRYLDNSVLTPVIDAPEVTNSVFFNTYTVTTATPFVISLTAENSPTAWSITSTHAFTVTVDNFGTFAGTIPLPGLYYINYMITNSGGSTTYPLTINAI